ncbi:MAG TPA: hypothetical protein VF139_17885 [Candidatus Polarisedimenticolaceae bacterium]
MPVTSRSLLAAAGGLLAVTAIVLLTIVSIGTVEHRSATVRFVAQVGPLEPEKYAPERVPDIENATRWIQRGSDALRFESDGPGLEGDRHWIERCATEGPAVIPADRLETVRAALSRNEPAFADVDKAIALPRSSWNIDYENGATADLPDLLAGIRLAKALACDGRLAIAEGDAARATRRIEALGRMARAYQIEPAMVVFLVGIAVERIQLVVVRDALASDAMPPDALVAVDASLGDAPLRDRWRASIAADAAAIHRTLQRTGAPGDHHAAGPWERVAQRALWSIAGQLWMAEHLDRTTRLHAAFETVPTRSAKVEASLLAPRPWWAKLFPDVLPNLMNGLERAAATETQRTLARRAIGIRLEAIVTRTYPPALDPPSTPADDPFSGEPFAWSVAADGSATLSAPATAREAPKVLLAVDEGWWTFRLPPPKAPTPPPAPSPAPGGPPPAP